MLNKGDKILNFTLPISGNKIFDLSNYSGKKIVLFFYPKDDTPGCTLEAVGFSALCKEFEKLNVKVFGISKDSCQSHDKFIEKHNLKVELISDEDGEICQKFGVWIEKSMFGKKYMGIERTTFLIDENGYVENIWTQVKPDPHPNEVLSYLAQNSN